jgi:Rps23 Pro-64 3,4-dihydroxylase Tpa1-like proline 4-hydroxylase
LTTETPLQLDRFEAALPELASRYASAAPFPHIVLDDVLRPDALAAAYADFAAIDGTHWTNYLHLNERKYANTDRTTWGPTLQAITAELSSPAFVDFLAVLTGIPGLQPDPDLDGGGLHRSLAGGFLNVHADFTAHHTRPRWRRRVNLLLYLNPTWDPAWGGELQLWSKDMQRAEATVEPYGNRMLLFTTDVDSYHGHPEPLRFPEGSARQSLALYYFTEEDDVVAHATNYRARPGDGARRALIYLDKKALQGYDVAKRRLHLSDGLVSRTLGLLNRQRR